MASSILSNDKCGDDRQKPRHCGGNELAHDDMAPFNQAKRLAAGQRRSTARVAKTPVRIAPSVPPTP